MTPIPGLLRRTRALLASALLLGACSARAASAQWAPARFDVTRDPFADLWYHGMAAINGTSYGPLPLYDAGYPGDVRETKRRRALVTPLDSSVAALRAAFSSDSAFDVLHFVPAYFVGEDPVAVLASLRSAFTGHGATSGRAPPSGLDARAAVVARSFASSRQRQTVVVLLDALAAEWRAFVRDDRVERGPSPRALEALRRDWDVRFAAPLGEYLADAGHARGVIVVSPAVGAEGRIVAPRGGRVVVIVGAHRDAGVTGAPLLAAVRELAFPLLDRVPPLAESAGGDRLAAERRREIAAVRGGAMLLESVAPALVPSYERLYLAVAGGRPTRDFARAFPLDIETETALRAATARYSQHGGIGR